MAGAVWPVEPAWMWNLDVEPLGEGSSLGGMSRLPEGRPQGGASEGGGQPLAPAPALASCSSAM